MGIKGLWKELAGACHPGHLSQFRGMRLGVDAYCWLHRAATASVAALVLEGESCDKFIAFFVSRVELLIRNGITPVLVFDGHAMPIKQATDAARKERREAARAEVAHLWSLGMREEATRLMDRAVDVTPDVALAVIEVIAERCKGLMLAAPTHYQAAAAVGGETRVAAASPAVEMLVAPYEADAQLAYLCKEGYIHGVISEDSDLLAYSCHLLLAKLDSAGHCDVIRSRDLQTIASIRPLMNTPLMGSSSSTLSSSSSGAAGVAVVSNGGATSSSQRSLLFACILSGCDYVPSLPGIGMKTALKLVAQHPGGSIDDVLRTVKQTVQGSFSTKELDAYEEAFHKAYYSFSHHLVYDPRQRAVVPFSPLPPGMPLREDLIGAVWSPELAVQVCQDIAIDPITLKPYRRRHAASVALFWRRRRGEGQRTIMDAWKQRSAGPESSMSSAAVAAVASQSATAMGFSAPCSAVCVVGAATVKEEDDDDDEEEVVVVVQSKYFTGSSVSGVAARDAHHHGAMSGWRKRARDQPEIVTRAAYLSDGVATRGHGGPNSMSSGAPFARHQSFVDAAASAVDDRNKVPLDSGCQAPPPCQRDPHDHRDQRSTDASGSREPFAAAVAGGRLRLSPKLLSPTMESVRLFKPVVIDPATSAPGLTESGGGIAVGSQEDHILVHGEHDRDGGPSPASLPPIEGEPSYLSSASSHPPYSASSTSSLSSLPAMLRHASAADGDGTQDDGDNHEGCCVLHDGAARAGEWSSSPPVAASLPARGGILALMHRLRCGPLPVAEGAEPQPVRAGVVAAAARGASPYAAGVLGPASPSIVPPATLGAASAISLLASSVAVPRVGLPRVMMAAATCEPFSSAPPRDVKNGERTTTTTDGRDLVVIGSATVAAAPPCGMMMSSRATLRGRPISYRSPLPTSQRRPCGGATGVADGRENALPPTPEPVTHAVRLEERTTSAAACDTFTAAGVLDGSILLQPTAAAADQRRSNPNNTALPPRPLGMAPRRDANPFDKYLARVNRLTAHSAAVSDAAGEGASSR